MQNRTDFNAIATIYDKLCQLVFGQKVKNAQIETLQFIPANSNILIVGGGTGWILEEITKIYRSGLRITYLEKSTKMIQLSQKRSIADNEITFLTGSIETIDLPDQKFDVIITPFILDCIKPEHLPLIFKKLDACLKINGVWLYTDFIISDKSKSWQKITIKLMYLFFRITCKLEVKSLVSLSIYFAPYKIIKEKTYLNNFITMQVFEKVG